VETPGTAVEVRPGNPTSSDPSRHRGVFVPYNIQADLLKRKILLKSDLELQNYSLFLSSKLEE
jgi:hypothetical protein